MLLITLLRELSAFCYIFFSVRLIVIHGCRALWRVRVDPLLTEEQRCVRIFLTLSQFYGDPTDMADPTSSYDTARIALWINNK